MKSWRNGEPTVVLRIVCALALLLTLAGAFVLRSSGTTAQGTGEADATVRFVHASPDSPQVDVLLDGTPVAQGLAFGAATEYAPLPAGDHQLQLMPSGQSGAQPLIDTQISAESGQAYIVAVQGLAAELEATVLTVNLDALDPGQARARLINAIPDSDQINVGIAGGDNWFEGVGFKDSTDYQTVTPGAYDLTVALPDSEAPLVTVPGIQITEGAVYDIFALGQIGAGTVTLLALETTVSQPCSALIGVGAPYDACVRFVHASPDAPAVDAYVGGVLSVQGLQFNTSTDFVNYPAGEQQIQVTASGAPATDAVIDTTQELEAGQAYQIVLTGTLEEIEATVNEVDLTPLPQGQVRVRLIHASPDAGQVDMAFGDGPPVAEGIDFRAASDYQIIDAASTDLVLYQAGEQTEVVRTTLDLQESMVYDVVLLGRAQDQSLQFLVLTAPTMPRQGEVATPVGSPMASPGASPVIGAPVPIGTPASPVAPPMPATQIPATPVSATQTPTPEA
jgi:hypothetical protein